MAYISDEDREVRRKLKVLDYARQIGDVSKTCRYFGIGRASFGFGTTRNKSILSCPPCMSVNCFRARRDAIVFEEFEDAGPHIALVLGLHDTMTFAPIS